MNLQQQAFVNAYLTEAKGNGTKAAIIAGYSERTAGVIASQLLKKPAIREAVEQQLEKADLSTQARLRKLAAIADHKPEKVTAADVVAANRLILQVNGALKDKESTSGLTVNIGFLQVNNASDPVLPTVTIESQAVSQVMPQQAPVALPEGDLGSGEG